MDQQIAACEVGGGAGAEHGLEGRQLVEPRGDLRDQRGDVAVEQGAQEAPRRAHGTGAEGEGAVVHGAAPDTAVQQVMNRALADVLRLHGFAVDGFGGTGGHVVRWTA